MSPRTSVITLTYNRPDWLGEAIASIEKQTDQDYEHMVYDNGSSDPRVGEVISAAAGRTAQLGCVATKAPGPDVVGLYWNKLIEMTSGKYITILDDDNRKRPGFIEKMIAPMEADETVGAVSCGLTPIDSNGRQSGIARHANEGTTLLRLWQTNTIDSNALCFRRSVLKKVGMFDPKITTNEDWHFVIRLVRHCKMVHLRDSLLEYREHPGARSRRALKLGAEANWDRIRAQLFTEDEERKFAIETSADHGMSIDNVLAFLKAKRAAYEEK